MGKDKTGKRSHKPLTEDIDDSGRVKGGKGRTKMRERKDKAEPFVGDNLSKKILAQAKEQQEELEEEFALVSGSSSIPSRKKKGQLSSNVSLGGKSDARSRDSSDESDDDDFDAFPSSDRQFYEQLEVDIEDEDALQQFMSKEPTKRQTLADIIMAKIDEKKTEIETQIGGEQQSQPLDERLVKVFKSVGQILGRYRAGKLPKAFKVIPSLANWEEVLYITEPDSWTAASMYQATRIFVSNLNANMAQRFFHLVLYPRVRDDIAEFKTLNYHLYMALKKALFKPAAFFKGILLPLCEAGDCTLREAVIIGSVLAKTSVPVLHSGAAMLKIAEMDYTGANSIFLRVLIDKKYALPYRVIDGVVAHFLRFSMERRNLPVLWHQSLLAFVQRYKEDLSTEQKDSLHDLCKAHNHYKITPEVRREIINSKSRDVEYDEGMEA